MAYSSTTVNSLRADGPVITITEDRVAFNCPQPARRISGSRTVRRADAAVRPAAHISDHSVAIGVPATLEPPPEHGAGNAQQPICDPWQPTMRHSERICQRRSYWGPSIVRARRLTARYREGNLQWQNARCPGNETREFIVGPSLNLRALHPGWGGPPSASSMRPRPTCSRRRPTRPCRWTTSRAPQGRQAYGVSAFRHQGGAVREALTRRPWPSSRRRSAGIARDKATAADARCARSWS